MSDEKALVPIEQRTITFYDDELMAVVAPDETVYVPMRPMVEGLGLGWSGAQQRISRDPVLSEVSMSVRITRTDIDQGSRQPRTSYMLALPLDYINGFLFGIQSARVKPELRPAVIRYQRECFRVLADAFLNKPQPPTPPQEMSPAMIAVQQAEAVYKLALQHAALEARMLGHEIVLFDHEQRIGSIEDQLTDTGRLVSPDQASQISQAVKAVAIAQGKVSGKNEFGAVYGELYRRFGITSYKQLPAARFGEAMAFLTDWFRDLTGNEAF